MEGNLSRKAAPSDALLEAALVQARYLSVLAGSLIAILSFTQTLAAYPDASSDTSCLSSRNNILTIKANTSIVSESLRLLLLQNLTKLEQACLKSPILVVPTVPTPSEVQFHVVLCNGVREQIKDVSTGVRQLRSILRDQAIIFPGGIPFASCFAKDSRVGGQCEGTTLLACPVSLVFPFDLVLERTSAC